MLLFAPYLSLSLSLTLSSSLSVPCLLRELTYTWIKLKWKSGKTKAFSNTFQIVINSGIWNGNRTFVIFSHVSCSNAIHSSEWHWMSSATELVSLNICCMFPTIPPVAGSLSHSLLSCNSKLCSATSKPKWQILMISKIDSVCNPATRNIDYRTCAGRIELIRWWITAQKHHSETRTFGGTKKNRLYFSICCSAGKWDRIVFVNLVLLISWNDWLTDWSTSACTLHTHTHALTDFDWPTQLNYERIEWKSSSWSSEPHTERAHGNHREFVVCTGYENSLNYYGDYGKALFCF